MRKYRSRCHPSIHPSARTNERSASGYSFGQNVEKEAKKGTVSLFLPFGEKDRIKHGHFAAQREIFSSRVRGQNANGQSAQEKKRTRTVEMWRSESPIRSGLRSSGGGGDFESLSRTRVGVESEPLGRLDANPPEDGKF